MVMCKRYAYYWNAFLLNQFYCSVKYFQCLSIVIDTVNIWDKKANSLIAKTPFTIISSNASLVTRSYLYAYLGPGISGGGNIVCSGRSKEEQIQFLAKML